MAEHLTTLTGGDSLTDIVEKFLSMPGVEGSVATPYFDSKGIVTVGVGINLSNPSFSTTYLNDLGITDLNVIGNLQKNVFTKPYTTLDELNADIKKYNNGKLLPSLSDDKILSLYQQIAVGNPTIAGGDATTYQSPDGKLSIYANFAKYIKDNHIDPAMLTSQEGVALLSLYFNAPATLGSKITADLNENAFNRVDAWYQIRYETNKGALTTSDPTDGHNGVAIRRDMESAVFGLYDPTDATNADGTPVPSMAEATSIYADFSGTLTDASKQQHSLRNWALNYEQVYSSQVDIATQRLTQSGLNGTPIQNLQVLSLENELQPAANTLNASLNDKLENPYYGHTAAFNPLDIQVATTAGGNDLVASQRNTDSYVLGQGGYLPSLLIAQGGNDTLDGSGTADDALIGGTGNDTFYVGSGNDYIVAGSGNALIEGGPNGSAIGSGNDTIVLGEANAPWKGGDDTVWGGSGNDVYYLGLQSQTSHIHLGSGHSTINVVYSPTDIAALAIDAVGLVSDPLSTVPLGESLFEDNTHHELVLSTSNSDGTKHLEIFDLPPLVSNSPSQAPRTQSLNAAVATGTTDTTGEIIIDGYTGNNLSGVQLTNSPTQTIQASNLSQLEESSSNVYEDRNTSQGMDGLDSVYGSDTSGSTYGNVIDGQGNAKYIYAGNGNNDVFTGEDIDSAETAWANAFNVTVQGGSGNQYLVGFGNSNETILGGDVGQDTTAWDTIDGGGGNGLLEGGTQNSVIYGGTGQDTLIAGSGTASGYNPQSFLLAGLSFWNGGGVEPGWSTPGGTAANFQVTLTNGTDTISLLGSSLDPATANASTLPGSLLIGGTGYDTLIGNQGNDTLIGGTPLHSVAGVTDEVLVGGAGADLIYGGDGNEWIFADMPASVANWADADPSDADTIYGGSGNDAIYGSGGNDEIYGGTGNYSIQVGNGNSYVDTGTGTAIVYGGSGADTLVADGSVDQIYSGSGNTLIEAEGSQSTIILQSGNDTIALGAGNNSIIEGAGATTLVTGLSGGSDVVQSLRGTTTVQLIEGLTESNLVARDVNGDLVLSDGGSAEVTLGDYFSAGGSVSLQFADGTTWGSSQILQASITPSSDGSNDTLVGSNGSDSITAGDGDTLIVGVSGNNTLTGGAGNDTIEGGSGADTIEGGSGTSQIYGGSGTETYIFNLGDGSDTIEEHSTGAGNDILQLGAGISASDLSFSYNSATNTMQIGFGSTSESTMTIENFAATQSGQNQISKLVFADGSSLSTMQMTQLGMIINGTTGNDNLIGTTGTDYFDGKGGNDTETGNGGSDTFVFNAGYGDLNITEAYAAGQQPVLQLGSGITLSSLHVTLGREDFSFNSDGDGSDLLLSDGVSGDQITLVAMLNSQFGNYGVARVQLADGTTLTASQLIQMEMTGTSGNDTIFGTSGNDRIDGKGGNDVVYGNSGNDTFVFNAGYGQLEIMDTSYADGQQPVLQMGTGITASTLRVTKSGDDLVLTDGIAGDQITLPQMWLAGISGGNFGIAAVQLADGTTLSVNQLLQMEMIGTTGNDTLYGTGGDDRMSGDLLDGKGGNDLLVGNGSNDTFVFNSGYGHLEISEAYTGDAQSVLQLGATITASALTVVHVGNNLVLTDGVGGDQITLDNMWSNSSAAGIGSVALADGSTLTNAQLLFLASEINGTSGNDTLQGTSDADLIDGKGGNDSVVGGGGSDTFVFNSGYGHLEINETYKNGEVPVLQLGAGITVSALHATKSGNNLVLSDGISSDQITLDGMWSTANDGVVALQLSDGTTLTRTQILALEMTGTPGADTITGTSAADVIDGKGGNDSVIGSGGNDTFVFNSGYGDLEINEAFKSGQVPVLQLGAGITASALHATKSGNNLVLTDGVSGDQVTLDGMWTTATDGVASVQLSDGTTLTRAQMIALEMTGTTGADTITGTSGADVIDGKGGNDSVVGSGGNDTFVFNSGYGHLEINEVYSGSQQPVLQFGAGITASSLHVTESANNLIVTDGVAGDQITLDKMWSTSTDGVGEVTFANGTTLTRAQLIQMEMTGTTGADTITGTSGADLIDGKGGNDSVIGSGGNDTFVFNSGYGHLQINEVYTSGQTPILQLGAGITSSALKVAKSGNNLVLTDGVSGDQITFNNMWTTATDGVAKVTLANGTSLTRSQLITLGTPAATKPVAQSKAMSTSADPIPVNTLIHAMASYGGSDPAAITTSPTLNPTTSDLLLHAAA